MARSWIVGTTIALVFFMGFTSLQADYVTPEIEALHRLAKAANTEMRNLKSVANGASLPLTAVTYNMGMLSVGGGTIIDVPYYRFRLKWLSEVWSRFLSEERPDFIFLQEIWCEEAFNTINRISALYGYIPAIKTFPSSGNWLGIPSGYGLQILVKRDHLQPGRGIDAVNHIRFDAKRPWYEVGIDIKRGLLKGIVTLANGERVLVATTHLSARQEQIEARQDQMDSLIDLLDRHRQDVTYIILGADMNISPELEASVTDQERKKWRDNAVLYQYFYDQMIETFPYVVDTFWVGTRRRGFTQDREYNVVARQGVTTGDEPSQRLDFIWIATTGADRGVFVRTAKLTLDRSIRRMLAHGGYWGFTEYEDAYYTLSDHFGVFSKFFLFQIESE